MKIPAIFGGKLEHEKPIPQDEPIVHTRLGNLRLSQLDYSTSREDETDIVTFIEEYRLKGTPEVVRRDSHPLYLCPGQTGKGGRLEQHMRSHGGCLPGSDVPVSALPPTPL